MRKKIKSIAIIGGGITGLVTAYYLAKEYKVFLIEKESFLGGTAAGFIYKEFILDYGPHKIYTEIPGILDEIKKICPLNKIKKKNSIHIGGNYYDFPLKISQIAKKMPLMALHSGADILLRPFSKKPDDSYENFLINRFGKTLYNLSFRDYAWKIWNSNPKELDKELAKRRVAVSGIFELAKSVLLKDTKKISAEYFYYPGRGIKQLIDLLTKAIKDNGGKIFIESEVREIKIKDKKVKYIKFCRHVINADYVISTIPLDSLLSVLKPEINENYQKIKYQKLNIIYFILKKQRALRDCWIFFPEREFIFQRISEQKAFSDKMSPKNKTAIMVETTKEIDRKLIEEIIKQLEKVKILKKEEIEEWFVKSIEKAYPVYKIGFMEELEKIEEYFDSIKNFYLLGRQGLFNYNNMDQCWDMSMKMTKQIKSGSDKKDWQKTRKYFESYRIVD